MEPVKQPPGQLIVAGHCHRSRAASVHSISSDASGAVPLEMRTQQACDLGT
jgi:hypothetical protein